MDLKELEDITNSWWPISISFLISAIVAIRMYVGGAKCPNQTRLEGKLAIVTGGSSGMGLCTAKELARRGAHVILAVRDEAKGVAAVKDIEACVANARVEARTLDVASMASIRHFSAAILAAHARIDILINNAGVHLHQRSITEEERLERTFATNYLGPFRLSHLLLPALRRAPGGRIVNVCGGGGARHAHATLLTVDELELAARDFAAATSYARSKHALALFTRHFARLPLLVRDAVTVNAVDPGLVRTGHLRLSLPTLPWRWLLLKSPAQGCQSALYVATDPTFETRTGHHVSECASTPLDALADDDDAHRRRLGALYARSCQLAGVEPLANHD